MKYSKSAIHRKFHSLPELAFEDHRLTSFSGLIVFQVLFAQTEFEKLLNRCFRHLKVSPIFGHGVVVMCWWFICSWAIVGCVIFATTRMTHWCDAYSD